MRPTTAEAPGDGMKPCPFCGEEINTVRVNKAGYGEILCTGCGTLFRFFLVDSIADVKRAWNRREK